MALQKAESKEESKESKKDDKKFKEVIRVVKELPVQAVREAHDEKEDVTIRFITIEEALTLLLNGNQ